MRPNSTNGGNDTVLKSIRLRRNVVNRVEELAEHQNRNFSNMLETLLIDILNYEEKRKISKTL